MSERVNELQFVAASRLIANWATDRLPRVQTVLNDLHPVLHLSTLQDLGPYPVPDTDSARQRRRIHC